MSTDTVEFWNEIWQTMDHASSEHDAVLMEKAKDLKPGRALEIGCGSGGNAVWLATQGWQVTAVDFSEVAIEKGRKLAEHHGAEVDFVVSDAATYQPEGQYDLITSFYIQLWPEQRAQMLANVSKALAPCGRLLFVSHDKSAPPSGWNEEDLKSLTTVEEVVAELPGLKIEQAEMIEEDGSHMAHMPDPEEFEGHEHHGHHEQGYDGEDHHDHGGGGSTVVWAVKTE